MSVSEFGQVIGFSFMFFGEPVCPCGKALVIGW